LLVFPDEVVRRPSLLFSAALVIEAVTNVERDLAGQTVLYLGTHLGIREQLGNMRVGNLGLDSVFQQEYARGGSGIAPVRGEAIGIGTGHLPRVVCVYAPADPQTLIKTLKPRWIAVDCGDSTRVDWLASTLETAKRERIPIVGWSSRPLSEPVAQWCELGGGMLRWPAVRPGAPERVNSILTLEQWLLDAVVTPRVLGGGSVDELSVSMARIAEILLHASELRAGRLASDAVMVAWRCLRTLEGLAVPLDLHEQEASGYWGCRRIADLTVALKRFLDALPAGSEVGQLLSRASEGLESLRSKLHGGESPLWLGLANLCVDEGDRSLVFASKSMRDMFAFGMLSRFDMSEEDLRGVGVVLRHLSSEERSASANGRPPRVRTFVGMPSRFAQRQFDWLLADRRLEILVWPHHLPLLNRRMKALAGEVTAGIRNLSALVSGVSDQSGVHTGQRALGVTIAEPIGIAAGALDAELQNRPSGVRLWTRPGASEAIETLFAANEPEEESPAASLISHDELVDSEEASWVDIAVELEVTGNQRLTLPADETVNVIVHVSGRVEVHERYIRSLRPGDELLFIQGQNRQSLYELLVSRVHQNSVIAQYLQLVRRWQEELLKAYTIACRAGDVSPERLLSEIQARGSSLISHQTIRAWLKGRVLAPDDVNDLRRIAEVLSMSFVQSYADQIHRAARRLKGLHIDLSKRLNRWLTSTEAGLATAGAGDETIDAELGLTMGDFRHSLLRLRVASIRQVAGPFYRSQLGRLEG
jgi:hypothetical protein